MKRLLWGTAGGQKQGAEDNQWQLWWEALPMGSTKVKAFMGKEKYEQKI